MIEFLNLLFPECYLVVAVTFKTDNPDEFIEQYHRYDPDAWDEACVKYDSYLDDGEVYTASLCIEVVGTDGGLNHKRIDDPRRYPEY